MEAKYLTPKELAHLMGVKPSSLTKYYYLGKDLPKRTRLPSGKKVIMIEDYNNWFKRSEKI